MILGASLLPLVLATSVSAAPVPDGAAAERELDAKVAGRPFSARRKIYSDLAFATRTEPNEGAPLVRLIAAARLRGMIPGYGPFDAVAKTPVAAEDLVARRARFIAVGDSWSRARQTSELAAFGGDGADETTRCWYAMFPYLYGPDPGDAPAFREIGSRFPTLSIPALMEYEAVRGMYQHRAWGFRAYAVPAALHAEALSALDRGYALATKEFGADGAWNAEWRRRLDALRDRSAAQPLVRREEPALNYPIDAG